MKSKSEKRVMKRIFASVMAFAVVIGCTVGFAYAASVTERPEEAYGEMVEMTLEEMGVVINNPLPDSIKVGQKLDDTPVSIENLLPYEELGYSTKLWWRLDDPLLDWLADCQYSWTYNFPASGWGPFCFFSDENGTEQISVRGGFAYRPGEVTFSDGVIVRFIDENGNFIRRHTSDEFVCQRGYERPHGSDRTAVAPITLKPIIIEEPVITHNAPAAVKSGDTLKFSTEITNTAYENTVISDRKDGTPFYTPVVEVTEGADIVSQTDRDYTHTLTTSETLTFTGEGTVKLKITYRPTEYHVLVDAGYGTTTAESYMEGRISSFDKTIVEYEFIDDDTVIVYRDGAIEEEVTINVTKDGGTGSDPSDTQGGGTSSDPSDTQGGGTGSQPSETQNGGTGSQPSDTQNGGTGSQPSDTQNSGTGSQDSEGNAQFGAPQTGDGRDLLIWTALLCASGAAVFTVVYRRKRVK